MVELAHFAPDLAAFKDAARETAADCIETPLLPFVEDGGRRFWLKAENLQPLGSFKIRAGANALATLGKRGTVKSIATASAGNFAQGLALAARRRGMSLIVHVPDTAPAVKRDAIAGLGARVVAHPFADWWTIMRTRQTGEEGVFVHPVAEPAVMVGNGVIALELARQCPACDEVFVPFGGGGMLCGIALAMRALGRNVRIVACEVETAAPLSASFAAGRPMSIVRTPSFVDGIGGQSVFEDMWPLLEDCVDDVVVVSLAAARASLRDLWRRAHLVAEGAGAVALAAARLHARGENPVAIISGGNIGWPEFRQAIEMSDQEQPT